MGKPSKKANAEVSAPSVSVPSAKSHKKGKRKAEEALEKVISDKKQKKDAKVVFPKQNEKNDKKSKKVSTQPPPKKKAEASSSEDTNTSDAEEGGSTPAEKDSSTEEDEEVFEDASDDEDQVKDRKPADEESSEDESSRDSEAEKAVKTPKKPQTLTSAQTQASDPKTLFVGNLPFDAGEDDIVQFFKDAGEVVDVRLATSERGGRLRGFCHAEFATVEVAQKALQLNGQELRGRPVKLEIAHEKGASAPQSGKESFQKGTKGQSQTVLVKGFNRNQNEDKIRGSLEEHFKSCGEITRISIPKDSESDAFKGIAFMDFKDTDAFSQALGLNGSEIEGLALTVEKAKPKNYNFSGKDGGHRGRGGRFGRRGGRGGGGRKGGRGGGRGRGRG